MAWRRCLVSPVPSLMSWSCGCSLQHHHPPSLRPPPPPGTSSVCLVTDGTEATHERYLTGQHAACTISVMCVCCNHVIQHSLLPHSLHVPPLAPTGWLPVPFHAVVMELLSRCQDLYFRACIRHFQFTTGEGESKKERTEGENKREGVREGENRGREQERARGIHQKGVRSQVVTQPTPLRDREPKQR